MCEDMRKCSFCKKEFPAQEAHIDRIMYESCGYIFCSLNCFAIFIRMFRQKRNEMFAKVN